MGAKAKHASGARRKKKGASKRAANAGAEEQHRYYPDSIPPGMTAEVFDVSRIDEDGLEVLDDDEVEQDPVDAVARPGSLRPRSVAPHPPRPSVRPRALAPDDLRLDTPLSYSTNPAAAFVERAPEPSVAARPSSGSGRALAFAVGGAVLALLVGLALGRRGGAASPSSVARVTQPAALERAAPVQHFSTTSAASAIDTAVARAQACRASGAPGGPLTVRLTFAQTGQVVGVDVRGPLAGTPAGDCFAAALRDARVPSFEGGIASVERTVEAR